MPELIQRIRVRAITERRPIAYLLILLSPAVAGAAVVPALVLSPGESRVVELAATESTLVKVMLAPNETATIIVFSLEAEIRLSLPGANGAEMPELANPIHGMPATEIFSLHYGGDEPPQFSLHPLSTGGQQTLHIRVSPIDGKRKTEHLAAEQEERNAKRQFALDDPLQLQSAFDALQRAADGWSRIDEPYREALALLMQSFVAKQMGDKTTTVALYRRAIDLQTEFDPWLYLQTALYSMDGSNRAATADLLADGLARSAELNDMAATSALQSATGLLHHMFGELDEAQQWYEQALESSRSADYFTQQAILANNMAGIHYVRGNPDLALQFFDRAIAAHERRGDRASIGEVLYNKGSLFFRLGEVQAALPLLLDALEETSAHETDSEQVAYTTAKIGSALLYLGNFTQARNFLNRALQLHQEHESWNQYASVLQLIGRLELAEGRSDEAMALHRDAIERFRDIERRSGEIRANLALADGYLAAGRDDDAAATAESALQMAVEQSDARLESMARLAAGRAYLALGEHDSAATFLLAAEEDFDGRDELQLRARAQVALGQLQLARQNHHAALPYARLAQAAVNDLRAKIPPADLRARFFAAQLEPYDLEIDIYMQQYLATNDADFAIDALSAAERAGARTLQELVGPGFVRNAGATSTIGLQQQINAKLMAARSFASQGGDDERARAERELQTLLLRADGSDALPGTAIMRRDIYNLQAALGEQRSILRYWVAADRGYWWLLTANSVAAGTIDDPSALSEAARALHASLKTPGRLDRKNLAYLREHLLPDNLSPTGEVFVVADGVLSVIPFQLLLATRDDAAAIRVVSYLPNAVALSGIDSEQTTPLTSALVIADPIYNTADNRLPRVARDAVAGSRPALTARDATHYRRLASTGIEADSIRRRIGPERMTLLSGAEASKSSILSLPELDADLLHFATHAFADAQLPELSSLVLSAYNADGAIDDRYLTLKEIYSLPLSARLVVLSACDTHIGRELRGEGVLGLSRGFIASGAKGVISTLWPVSDKATSRFMDYFYASLLTDGQRPAAALAAAQKSMRATPRYRDPYFWAGFVLLGQ